MPPPAPPFPAIYEMKFAVDKLPPPPPPPCLPPAPPP